MTDGKMLPNGGGERGRLFRDYFGVSVEIEQSVSWNLEEIQRVDLGYGGVETGNAGHLGSVERKHTLWTERTNFENNCLFNTDCYAPTCRDVDTSQPAAGHTCCSPPYCRGPDGRREEWGPYQLVDWPKSSEIFKRMDVLSGLKSFPLTIGKAGSWVYRF